MSSPNPRDHAWLPRATCDTECLRAGGSEASRRLIVALRVARRSACAAVGAGVAAAGGGATGLVEGQAVVLPAAVVVSRSPDHVVGWSDSQSARCAGGQRPHVLAGHPDDRRGAAASRWRTSPLSFVARADVAGNPAVRMMARIIKVIPINRASLRQLPGVVAAVATRLRAGHTVVAFPEGTTWCGLALWAVLSGDVSGRRGHRPAGPAAAAALPPPRRQGLDRSGLYRRRHVDAFDRPAAGARRTVARVYVESLQLPGADRRELARRCQAAVRITAVPGPGHRQRPTVLAS